MSSTATASSEESTCTIPKQLRLDEDSFSNFDNKEIFLDRYFLFLVLFVNVNILLMLLFFLEIYL
jgi:hypothetical protein